VLSPDINQMFLPLRSNPPAAGASLVYHPMLLGCGSVYFTDSKSGIDQREELCLLAPITDNVVAVDWSSADETDLSDSDLEREPASAAPATFAPLPAAASKAKSYDAWKKAFSDALLRGRQLQLFRCASLKELSKPGESERDFRVRLTQAGRETRDQTAAALRQKYAAKLAALQERRRRAEQAVEREREQASASKWQTAISVGSTLLGAFMGRKLNSASNIGHATTAARGATRAYKESQDVARAGETVQAVDQMIADLNAQLEAETNEATAACDPQTEPLETVTLKPKKTNITVRSLVLAWAPYWSDAGSEKRAWE
jgi:hypothetical protein